MEYGKQTDMNMWIDEQKRLLTEHDFKTPTGRLLRNVQIDEQIGKLMESVQQGDSL